MSKEIWRKKGGAVTHMVTLGDFAGAADDVLPGHLAGKAQLADIVRCFQRIEGNYLLAANPAGCFDGILESSTYTLSKAEAWLTSTFAKSFAHAAAGERTHLPLKPSVYLQDAKALIESRLSGLGEADKGEALAYLTLVSWVFAQKLSAMSSRTQQMLLSLWKPSLCETLYINDGDRFAVGFGADGDQPLVRRLLASEWDSPVSIILTDPDGGEHRVCFPPHTRRLALFCGDTMTCIKPCIAAGSAHALLLAGDQLLRLSARPGARPFPYQPDEAQRLPTDYTSGYFLYDRDLTDHSTGVLAVFQGSFAVKVMEDGRMRANHSDLNACREPVLSVVQDRGDLHAVMRGGQILTTGSTAPDQAEALRLMLAPYAFEGFAERIPVQGGAYLLSSDGAFEYQKGGDGA